MQPSCPPLPDPLLSSQVLHRRVSGQPPSRTSTKTTRTPPVEGKEFASASVAGSNSAEAFGVFAGSNSPLLSAVEGKEFAIGNRVNPSHRLMFAAPSPTPCVRCNFSERIRRCCQEIDEEGKAFGQFVGSNSPAAINKSMKKERRLGNLSDPIPRCSQESMKGGLWA